MNYLLASTARKNLYKLIDEVALNHEPALIKGKRNAVVLISSQDWEDIQETLFVASNQKLSNSIMKNLNIDFEDCSDELE